MNIKLMCFLYQCDILSHNLRLCITSVFAYQLSFGDVSQPLEALMTLSFRLFCEWNVEKVGQTVMLAVYESLQF
jgi:hypothetical protein